MSRINTVKPIQIIQGAQYGSEAKGAVAAFLCQKKNVEWAVRTGAVNAGHTVYWPDAKRSGIPIKMQQLPVGWVNPRTQLVIGAGAFIYPDILLQEIDLVSKITGEDITKRLFIDHRASLHLPKHQERAKEADRHHLIGATGKGCSEAMVAKIRERGSGYILFKEWYERTVSGQRMKDDLAKDGRDLVFVDTQHLLHTGYDSGQLIQLEGTQGSLLDLHLGPYPYTTNKQTSAANWVTEAGLAPGMSYETVMVARTYPIRVAGNSGPMPNETNWPNLAREINKKLMLKHQPQRVKSYAIADFEASLHEVAMSGKYPLPAYLDNSPNFDMHLWDAPTRVKFALALSEMNADALKSMSVMVMQELMYLFELTTVTKKLRRIAQWDPATVSKQCKFNRASYLVLTFWNYWYPETWAIPADRFEWLPDYRIRLRQVEDEIECKVKYITTGPGPEHVVEAL